MSWTKTRGCFKSIENICCSPGYFLSIYIFWKCYKEFPKVYCGSCSRELPVLGENQCQAALGSNVCDSQPREGAGRMREVPGPTKGRYGFQEKQLTSSFYRKVVLSKEETTLDKQLCICACECMWARRNPALENPPVLSPRGLQQCWAQLPGSGRFGGALGQVLNSLNSSSQLQAKPCCGCHLQAGDMMWHVQLGCSKADWTLTGYIVCEACAKLGKLQHW